MSAWRIYLAGAFVLIASGVALTFLGDKGHFVRWLALHRHPWADYYFYHVTKLGEEYGFIGVTLVILMFGIFVFRGFKLAKTMDEDFGKFLAFGITTIIAMNASVNMLVASGMIPTTGQTLPFISYGGTSIIFNSIAIGILLNISTRRMHPKGTLWVEQLARKEEDDQ